MLTDTEKNFLDTQQKNLILRCPYGADHDIICEVCCKFNEVCKATLNLDKEIKRARAKYA